MIHAFIVNVRNERRRRKLARFGRCEQLIVSARYDRVRASAIESKKLQRLYLADRIVISPMNISSQNYYAPCRGVSGVTRSRRETSAISRLTISAAPSRISR